MSGPVQLFCFEDPYELENLDAKSNFSKTLNTSLRNNYYEWEDQLLYEDQYASLPSLWLESEDYAGEHVPSTPGGITPTSNGSFFSFDMTGANISSSMLEDSNNEKIPSPAINENMSFDTVDCQVPNVSPALWHERSTEDASFQETESVAPDVEQNTGDIEERDSAPGLNLPTSIECSKSSDSSGYFCIDDISSSSQSSSSSENTERRVLDSCGLEYHVVPDFYIEE